LDNGAFSCWKPKTNTFDDAKWARTEAAWQRLIVWAQVAPTPPLWAILPDVPGNAVRTLEKWLEFAPGLTSFPRALAVQDGMTVAQVQALKVQPDVIAIGGTTDWKWATLGEWVKAYRRIHVLRVNQPPLLYQLEELGVESCDGTGWTQTDRRDRSAGLEAWARSRARPVTSPLWPYACRQPRDKDQESFA
jgi:hypothetical protein